MKSSTTSVPHRHAQLVWVVVFLGGPPVFSKKSSTNMFYPILLHDIIVTSSTALSSNTAWLLGTTQPFWLPICQPKCLACWLSYCCLSFSAESCQPHDLSVWLPDSCLTACMPAWLQYRGHWAVRLLVFSWLLSCRQDGEDNQVVGGRDYGVGLGGFSMQVIRLNHFRHSHVEDRYQ